MFLESSGEVCIDGVPATVDIYGVGCWWWLRQFHKGVDGRLCCWWGVGGLGRVRACDGENPA